MEKQAAVDRAQSATVDPLVGLQSLVRQLAEALALPKTTDILVNETRQLAQTASVEIALLQTDRSLAGVDGRPLAAPVREIAATAVTLRTSQRQGELVALPLIVRNRPLGALVLQAPRETRQSYLDAIATHAALALDRAILHESESTQREELEESESRFRSLVQELDAIFWECDPRTFQFTFVSERAERVLGYPNSRWLEPGFWPSVIHPEDKHWAVDFCVECTKEGRDHAFEYRMVAADGSVRWFRDVVYVLRDAGGRPTTLRGVMLDITHERHAVPRGRVARRIRSVA